RCGRRARPGTRALHRGPRRQRRRARRSAQARGVRARPRAQGEAGTDERPGAARGYAHAPGGRMNNTAQASGIERAKAGAREAVRGALGPIVTALARLGVKPDHITWLGLLVTIAGGVLFG